METDWYFQSVLLFVFLLFSAFFSGSEVALFSFDKKKIRELNKTKNFINHYIITLIEAPRRLLVTILLGNTIFNVASSILAVSISIDIARIYNLSVDIVILTQIVVLTVLIIVFGEILPKVWATRHPIQFAKIIALPLYWISIIIYPVSKILTDTFKTLFSKMQLDKSKMAILQSEIQELADLGVEKGTLEENEQGLIQGLVGFNTVSVREVMTPRVDITAVSVDTDFDEMMELITESGHSRIPLYDENLDNIIGIIYAKDLLPYLSHSKSQEIIKISKIARKAYFVPETKLINDLMHEFQEKNIHLGIVVDEYGGTAGLVSLEDILEEIVGEIRDEYDQEETEISKVDDDTYVILGKAPIDDLNEILDFDFSSENDDYDTVGGFIYNHAGTIPEQGDSVVYEKFKFTVKEIENKRINKILLKILDKPEN